MSDGPDRICGALTTSDRYCQRPAGECPYHEPATSDVDVEAARESLAHAMDLHRAPGNRDAFVWNEMKDALDALETEEEDA